MHFIYKITNIINDKVYIGQTNNPVVRWTQHKSVVRQGKLSQIISRAIAKHGEDKFQFIIIASCPTQEDANELEGIVINQYDSCNMAKGYNVAPGGKAAPSSEETKRKLSELSMGKPGTNTGKTFSNEWRLNISKSLMGKSLSEDHIRNLSESHKGQIAPNRKITFDIAEIIRFEYKSKDITQKQLGKKYGLAQSSIFDIVNGITYTK